MTRTTKRRPSPQQSELRIRRAPWSSSGRGAAPPARGQIRLQALGRCRLPARRRRPPAQRRRRRQGPPGRRPTRRRAAPPASRAAAPAPPGSGPTCRRPPRRRLGRRAPARRAHLPLSRRNLLRRRPASSGRTRLAPSSCPPLGASFRRRSRRARPLAAVRLPWPTRAALARAVQLQRLRRTQGSRRTRRESPLPVEQRPLRPPGVQPSAAPGRPTWRRASLRSGSWTAARSAGCWQSWSSSSSAGMARRRHWNSSAVRTAPCGTASISCRERAYACSSNWCGLHETFSTP
mmetsp:Transcript_48208/g.97332  ORF Transcript_48208/g.97332 Transcript_48208/m.97332 type:complete len:291 (-) Transcript_48208:62-934(-)